MDSYLDILLAITSIIAAGFPITVYLISKKNKLAKTKNLIELLEYHSKIKELQKQDSENDQSPVIKDKLISLLSEVEDDLINQTKKLNITLFISVVTIEIFLAFNKLSKIVLAKPWESGFYFLEGVFKLPTVRIIGLLLIFLTAFIISFRLINWLKEKYKIANNIMLNIYLIALFNLIFIATGIAAGAILAILDKYITWF